MPTNYDQIANIYQKSNNHPIKLYCEAIAFQNILGNLTGQSVLDLACGGGFYTRLIERAGARRIVGVDFSKAMIEQAIAHENDGSTAIEYQVGDVLHLNRIALFDQVTAVYLFPYADTVETLVTMFQTIYNNLKPGGRFVGITMNPHLKQTDFLAYRPYGITLSAAGPLLDGTSVAFNVLFPDGGSMSLQTTYWSQTVYEAAMKQVGLREINWHTIAVSKEGYHHFDETFWQAYKHKPYSLLLTCSK